MSDITQSGRTNLAFKKLQNKAQTQQDFEVNEEFIFSAVQLGANLIPATQPVSTPLTSVGTNPYDNDGVVERVQFNVVRIEDTLIGTNQSQGWQLQLPSDYTANGFLNFTSNTVLWEQLGKLQLVSPLFGEDYAADIINNDGDIISPTSPFCFVIDYVNGTLFVENPDLTTNFDISSDAPSAVTGYLYIGDFVNEALTASTSLLTGATNGLTVSNKNVELGGTLTGNTIIDLDTNNLEFTNGNLIASGLTLLDLFDQSLTGFSTTIDATSTNQELVTAADVYDFVTGETASIVTPVTGAANGLTLDASSNVVLGGTLTGTTTIDGGGNLLTLTGLSDTIINLSSGILTLESENDFVELKTPDTILLSGGNINLISDQISFDFQDVTAQDRTIRGFTTIIDSTSNNQELVTAADVYDFVTGQTNNKQDKDVGDIANNVAVKDGNGNSVDSGIPSSDLELKTDLRDPNSIYANPNSTDSPFEEFSSSTLSAIGRVFGNLENIGFTFPNLAGRSTTKSDVNNLILIQSGTIYRAVATLNLNAGPYTDESLVLKSTNDFVNTRTTGTTTPAVFTFPDDSDFLLAQFMQRKHCYVIRAGGTRVGTLTGTVTLNLVFGGTNVLSLNFSGTDTFWEAEGRIYINEKTSTSDIFATLDLNGTKNAAKTTADITIDKDFYLSITTTDAADTLTVEHIEVEVYP